MGFDHPDPEAVIVDTSGQAEAAEAGAVADIEVARINAERDVEVAKINARQVNAEDAATMAALMARVEVLEASLIPPEPPAEPEPVVIAPPEPAAPAESGNAMPDVAQPPKESKKKSGWFADYR